MGRWTRVAAVALPLFAAIAFAPGAFASPGQLIRTVKLPLATTGVSIAFDGQYLYYTNEGEPVLHRVNTDGTNEFDVPIVGAPSIDALSYDATRDKFWGVGGDQAGFETIYLIDKTGAAVPAFDVSAQVTTYRNCDNTPPLPGCVPPTDGISYDGTNDTVWYSPDQSSRVYEFDAIDPNTITGLAGYLVGFFDVNDGNQSFASVAGTACGKFDFGQVGSPDLEDANFNSGVAVSGGNVYLGAPDCSSPTTGQPTPLFFDYSRNPTYCPNDGTVPSALACASPRPCLDAAPVGNTPAAMDCPGNALAFYSYAGTRDEDLECDDVTFNVDVVWIRDETDGTADAYEVPAGSCIFGGGVHVQISQSRMTGGGYLAGLTGNAYHGFMVHCDARNLPNRLQVSFGNGMHFHMTSETTATCKPSLTTSTTNNEITGSGVGRLNGQPNYQVTWDFTDNGEPGTNDMGTIKIMDPAGVLLYTWTGPLLGGNYQMHNAS